jgi:hypothetical protein
MAARNKPAGIRSIVYGIGKGKVRIEGLSVLDRNCSVFFAHRYSIWMDLFSVALQDDKCF